MRYQLALFDFDGTLADTFPWFASVLNDVADHFGFRKVETDAEIAELRSLGSREIIERLGVPMWKLPMIARHMRRLATENVANVRLFDGVPAMLDLLRRHGVRVAVVSSNSERNVRHVLGASAPLIELYACGASLFGKTARFRKVLGAMSIAAADALCVGDELRDADAAAQAGIAFGAVSWGFTNVAALRARSPRHTFETVDDLARTLLG